MKAQFSFQLLNDFSTYQATANTLDIQCLQVSVDWLLYFTHPYQAVLLE